jgi:DNA-binding NarL/FixJ family response regulator
VHARSQACYRSLVIRVLLVDDEPDLLILLSVRFDLEDDIRVVGTASSGGEAIELVHLLEPDLVVMDLLMPGTDGFEAIRRIREERSTLPIVAYSAVVNEMARRQVERYRVPLVLKQGDSAPLIQVIRDAAAGA